MNKEDKYLFSIDKIRVATEYILKQNLKLVAEAKENEIEEFSRTVAYEVTETLIQWKEKGQI
jgi:uncharacterized protein YdiU (UPF0061 family)